VRWFLAGLIGSLSLVASSALAEPACGVLDTQLRPASSDLGHRVGVIFTDFGGQHIIVTANGETILDTTLTTSNHSTGLSGLIQCQFEGRTDFSFDVDGDESRLNLTIDRPTNIYFSQGRNGPQFAVFESSGEGLLLD
jgi:hypothetical protein